MCIVTIANKCLVMVMLIVNISHRSKSLRNNTCLSASVVMIQLCVHFRLATVNGASTCSLSVPEREGIRLLQSLCAVSTCHESRTMRKILSALVRSQSDCHSCSYTREIRAGESAEAASYQSTAHLIIQTESAVCMEMGSSGKLYS